MLQFAFESVIYLSFLDNPKKSSSTWITIRRIYSQSGVRGLFTGLTPRLVKVAPACALMISTFEYGKRFFQRYNANNALIAMNGDIQLLNQKQGPI